MRVLTINSHQPYVYDLARLSGIELHVIDDLPGRPQDKWQESIRPLPPSTQLQKLDDALRHASTFDVFIAHNLTDLSTLKSFQRPAVLLIHSSLDRLLATQETTYSREDIHRILYKYVKLKHVVVASVSNIKAASWGITDCPIIPFFTDTDYFHGYQGSIPHGLRVANHLVAKGAELNLEFFTNLVEGFKVKLVGDNPQLNTQPASSKQELLQLYQTHRYYIHTAAEGMEDGYNMASLEAMATGMPVICNQHSTAPVINEKSGFMSSDVTYLREKIAALEVNEELARQLGHEARRYVMTNHSLEQFDKRWMEVLDLAIRRYQERGASSANAKSP